VIFAVLMACGTEWPAPADPVHPLDDTLRIDQIQAKGTHNSYHVATPGMDHPELQYQRDPLMVQLGQQGVRHFELDVDRDPETGHFFVRHIPLIDEMSHCAFLPDCFRDLRHWSDFNPEHGPLVVLVEVKGWDPEDPTWFEQLEADVLEGWPDRLITPDDVQGDYASVADAVADRGWPTLGEGRGKLIVVLHAGTDVRQAYTDGDTTTEGRLLFPKGGGNDDAPVIAFDIIDDPVAEADFVAEALAKGRMVRGRIDGVLEHDAAFAAEAIATGAQWVSTDWPGDSGEDVRFDLPGGAPYRCNPVNAPSECTSEAIEDPAYLDADGPGPGF
jgi:hypothetical protein